MNLKEFIEHCYRNGHKIFIRYKVNGKWGNYNLFELNEIQRTFVIADFFVQDRMPIQLRRLKDKIIISDIKWEK